MGYNKVLYNGKVLVDLTGDTVTADKLLKGVTAHDKAGNQITGTYEGLDISAETADYTAKLETQNTKLLQIVNLLKTKFAVPSTLQNKTVTPSTSQQAVTADSGYDGLNTVTVQAIPQSYTDEIYDNGYAVGYEAGCNAAKPYKSELAYIQSSGTQYVNSEFYPSGNSFRVVIKFRYTTSHDGLSLFGNASSSQFAITVYGSKPVFYVGTSNAVSCGDQTSLNTDYVLDVTAKDSTLTAIWNGTTYTASYSGSLRTDRPMFVFGSNSGDGAVEMGNGYLLEYIQFYDNDTLVRDYIPVLDWDDVPCLYDKVKRKMYYNAGTGEFAAGEMVA